MAHKALIVPLGDKFKPCVMFHVKWGHYRWKFFVVFFIFFEIFAACFTYCLKLFLVQSSPFDVLHQILLIITITYNFFYASTNCDLFRLQGFLYPSTYVIPFLALGESCRAYVIVQGQCV